MEKPVKILLSGGGTAGSVSPLLSIYEILRRRSDYYDFIWLGTKDGPEKAMVESAGIKFRSISGGKLRRFFSGWDFFDPIKIIIGFWQSLYILWRWRAGVFF